LKYSKGFTDGIEARFHVARHAIPAANIQNNPAEFASFPPIFFAL
jgi:hypothetical protein